MRKFAKTLITCLLLCSMVMSLFACGERRFVLDEQFKASNDTVVSTGGFITETEKFYYVINGNGNNADNNNFGSVLNTGSLVAIKKDDMTKSAVVVPKLFVSSDYNAGVYVFDGYAYFATPSTDKKLTGETKNTSLVFAKAKLDGTDYVEFVTVSSLSTEFRYIKTDAGVVVVYYDSAEKALVELNTKTLASKTIFKTDEKAGDSTKNESLDSYKFFDNKNLDKGVVAFTTKIYIGKYIEETTRATEKYNKLYIYTVGKELENVKDGSKVSLKDESYSIVMIDNGELIYKVKTITPASELTYIGLGEDAKKLDDTKKYDASHLIDGEDFYFVDADSKKIMKNDKAFAEVTDVTTLLFIKGEYVYYISSANKIARVKENEKTAESLLEDTISTSWYKPALVGNYIFFCDSLSVGKSNTKYLDLNSEIFEQNFVLRNDSNKVAELQSQINSISKTLDDNGKITAKTSEKIELVTEQYNALSEEEKASIESKYKEIEKYQDAIKLSKTCQQLKDIENELTDVAKEKFAEKYETAKAEFVQLEEKGQVYFDSVCKLMEGNTYYWFNYARNNVFKAD